MMKIMGTITEVRVHTVHAECDSNDPELSNLALLKAFLSGEASQGTLNRTVAVVGYVPEDMEDVFKDIGIPKATAGMSEKGVG